MTLEETGVITLHCLQMGATARQLLAQGASGRVLAGFSQAIYLLTEQGEVLWLAGEGVPLHARGLRIAGALPRQAAGAAFRVAEGHIEIDTGLQVDVCAAATWTAPPIVAAVPPLDELPRRLHRAFAADAGLRTARGLGRLIPAILALARGEEVAAPGDDPVLARAWPAIRSAWAACLVGDVATLWREAAALAGLGAGLTPSGDDFLGGFLFGLDTVERLYPRRWLDAVARARFVAALEGRTHAISFTMLRDLAAGQAVEPLHELMGVICSQQAPGNIRCAAARLTCIGHSTGWDLLAGVVASLLPAVTSWQQPGIS